MKKIICLLTFLVTICGKGNAQDISDIYLICTSTTNENLKEGIWRHDADHNDPTYKDDSIVYNDRPITFVMISKSKRYELWFFHYNYNLVELAKTRKVGRFDYQMEIVIRPRTFYSNTIERAKHYNLDDKINSFKSAREAWDWANTLIGKRIYILDNTDLMNWGEEGDGNSIRLVEVRLYSTNEPQEEFGQ